MIVLHLISMPAKRPGFVKYSGVRELYLHFQNLFLDGGETHCEIVSSCGHLVRVFDHHFFHMVKLDDPFKPKPLKMSVEKSIILDSTSGFGDYKHDAQRAIYLSSAIICLKRPDEVWDDPTLRTARWVYIKEFDTKPYCFTILLAAERDEGIVPATSFPCKKRDVRKWRNGVRIYPQNTSATQ
jgi:hypothetical protein